MSRKNLIIIVVAVIVIIIASVLGVFLYNKQREKDESEKVASIAEFRSRLEGQGLQIESEAESTDASAIGAVEGVTYVISGYAIQVYRYDLNSTDELSVSNVKKAQEEGKISLPEFDNHEFTVIYNKGLILINHTDHPEKDKIVEAFESL